MNFLKHSKKVENKQKKEILNKQCIIILKGNLYFIGNH